MADEQEQSVALPSIVDLDTLDPIRDQLIEAIDHGSVVVEAAGVERVATNALFMLMSAAETARRNETGFSISEPSEQMVAAIDRLGLGESFTPLLRG